MQNDVLADRFAAVWDRRGRCQLYVENAAAIDALRSADVQGVGLPDRTMRSLWELQPHLKRRSEDFASIGLDFLQHALMFVVDRSTGDILECWEAADPWIQVSARLREVYHAA